MSLGLVSGEDGTYFSPEDAIKIATLEKGGNVVLIGQVYRVPGNDDAYEQIDGEAFVCAEVPAAKP